MASKLQKPHRNHMIKVLLNTTLQPEKIRLKEVGTFTIRCMGHQSHGHWEPGCFALSLLLYQFQFVPPCQLTVLLGFQGKVTSWLRQPLGILTMPSLLIIKLTLLMTKFSNSLVPRTVVPLCKPCRHLCVYGTLSQTCINIDTGKCFKLLNTSRVGTGKVPGMDFSIHPWSDRTSSANIYEVEKETEKASYGLEWRSYSQRIKEEEGMVMHT